MAEGYMGPFVVLPRALRRARPAQGEILRHAMPDGTPDDSYRMRCPFCNAISHVWGRQIGDPACPTFDRPLRCGCGARCGRSFRIRSGRVEPCEGDPVGLERVPLSEDLERAGVQYGPRRRRGS